MAQGYNTRAYNLEEFIDSIDAWGVMDVLLPFLLIFTIVFAILSKSNALGKDKKNINLVVAFVMAMTVVTLHVTDKFPQDYDVVDIMNAAIPNIMLIMVAGFALLLFIGIFGGSTKTKELSFYFTLATVYLYIVIFVNSVFPDISIWVPIISILIIVFYLFKKKSNTSRESGTVIASAIAIMSFSFVLYYFGFEAGWFQEIPWWLQSSEAIYFILTLSIIAAVISFVLRDGDDSSGSSYRSGGSSNYR